MFSNVLYIFLVTFLMFGHGLTENCDKNCFGKGKCIQSSLISQVWYCKCDIGFSGLRCEEHEHEHTTKLTSTTTHTTSTKTPHVSKLKLDYISFFKLL